MQATSAPTQASVDAVAVSLATLMRHLMTETSPDFFKEVERLELTFSQVKALNLLRERAPLSPKGLSEVLGLSLPAVSRAVEQLVVRGMVTRTEDPDDRRSRRLALTAKGQRTIDGLVQLRLAGVKRFVAGLEPEEREALMAGLTPLMGRAEMAQLAPKEDSR
ncbi:MAG: MarR family transcriptional regulator [Actinomycetota bacterium]